MDYLVELHRQFGLQEFLEWIHKLGTMPYYWIEKMSPMYRTVSRVQGTKEQLRIMAARSQWALEEVEQIIGVVNRLYTFSAFIGSLIFVPLAVSTYLVVSTVQSFFYDYLTWRYPHLEFVRTTSLRTAIDTHRNQGVISLLLEVKGTCDVELVKRKLEENVLERRNAEGKICYPHMKKALTTRWGRYAWVKPKRPFSMDNHVVTNSSVFKGRPINELNIQEYVSGIVAKYLSPDLSPWQLTLIPSLPSQEDRFYLLIRVHHLILSEDRVGLGDLLLLKHDKCYLGRRLGEDDENFVQLDQKPYRPLIYLNRPLVALPKLYNTIRTSFNSWLLELRKKYDPVADPNVLKRTPTLLTCTVVLFLTATTVIYEMYKRTGDDNLKSFLVTVRSEAARRQCTIKMFFFGMLNTLSPKRMIKVVVSCLWWMLIKFTLKIPLSLLRECLAVCGNSAEYPGTTTEWLHRYWGLITLSAQEVWHYWLVLYTGPRILMEELIISHQLPKHQLQTQSLCGRKVVAWSDPVPLELVRKIKDATGVSQSEILTNATAGALREYFRQYGLTVPDTVLATARFFPEETLLATSRTFETGIAPSTGGGSLCLALPTSNLLGQDALEGLYATSEMLKETRTRQPILYVASLWQLEKGLMTKMLPTVLVRLILNYLTRRYAVSLTEVASNCGSEAKRQLVWGQNVESIMYWRPPQANICLSLTMMSYGDSVRLGVMSDSLLSPHHAILASAFIQQLNELALAAGIPRDRQSQKPGTSRFSDRSTTAVLV